MPISGLVVRIDPDQRTSIVDTLSKLDNVELSPTPEGETLVVVLDVATLQEEEELFTQIDNLPGVASVTLSYHNFEDLNEAQNH